MLASNRLFSDVEMGRIRITPVHAEDARPEPEVVLYTDGSCVGGNGGWAFILIHKTGKTREESGASQDTTANRMEMQAAIEGLSRLKRPCQVLCITDSQYLQVGASRWMHRWKVRG